MNDLRNDNQYSVGKCQPEYHNVQSTTMNPKLKKILLSVLLWFVGLGFIMLLHWVAGHEFVRGSDLAWAVGTGALLGSILALLPVVGLDT